MAWQVLDARAVIYMDAEVWKRGLTMPVRCLGWTGWRDKWGRWVRAGSSSKGA
jgi:hypothetical protein